MLALSFAMLLGSPCRIFAQLSPAIDQFGVATTTLPNGLKIIVCPRHAVAIAAIDVWADAGTRRQKPGQEAVAHYLEHLLFTGTPTHPAETDIDGAIEDLGGSLDAGTSYDWAHFYTVVPTAGFDAALGVMADVLQHPTLAQAAVDSERPVIDSEIQGNNDDPATYAEQTTRAALFGSASPYGQPITGTVQQADAVQRSTVEAFYHENYRPSRVTVVVAGDVSPEQVQSAVSKAFGGWKEPPAAPVAAQSAPGAAVTSALPASGANTSGIPPEAASSGGFDAPLSDYLATSGVVGKTVNRPSPNSFLVFGWPAPSVSQQPETWIMDVLLTYLGQGGRNALDDDLHLKRHIVDGVAADYLTQHDPGMLTITLSLPTANTEDAVAGVLAQVKAVRETALTESQLDEAKQQLVASYLFQTETISGKADSLGFYATINSAQYDENYLNNIASVTSQQVQKIAQKYLSPTHYVLTTLTPPTDPRNAERLQPETPPNEDSAAINAAARSSRSFDGAGQP